jgi:chromosome partitioning protein
MRFGSALPLKIVKRNIAHLVKKAKQNGIEWVFIDTPPNNSASVVEAIEAATLVVIPCRPGLFDIEAVQDTIALARHSLTPYAVVLNAAPPKRQGIESPGVTLARRYWAQLEVPVWAGQIATEQAFRLPSPRVKVSKDTMQIHAQWPKSAACGQR